ncbi:prepilin peptidase [Streptococcus macacae]|uniref:Peptidase, A24 type IV prepilin peptidase family protein n=1 Tax=Streptococcus macacae NCTC 11558 TaxID=764298 RepID=G5JW08_9STRE|nr:A24 family peptidase [Streptococcus macacae]EHJ52397.1 peptidase, A24 type IV prepilin peptidase family protein [Streptococcus macacae NCTC 11558]SUN79001.1 signal peptidase type IV [Streptococcus macacae NCTC 11558]
MKFFLFFCLGSSLGSFIGLIIDRFPEKSIIFPNSYCNYCKHSLAPRDLIPILSQIINKNRCRFCGYPIPFHYLLLELFCGSICLLYANGCFSFSQLILLFMGILLSLYDLKDHSYPIIFWLAFTFFLMVFYPLNLISLFLFFLGLYAALKNIQIGSGDLLYLSTLALSLNFQEILWVVQIASLLGIVYYLFCKKEESPIAFVPFLFSGYIAVLFFL